MEIELPPEEEATFLMVNKRLQQALLTLVRHCHQPDLQTTLNCALSELDDDLSRRRTEAHFAGAVLLTQSMKKILAVVLTACFDVSRDTTVLRMQEGFTALNTKLVTKQRESQAEAGM